ncbi:MAG TPA: DUF5602 domain-containing protein [Sporichthyaceae bacterium]|nr:DUF5602 domain-containing protein [Sporichthyaceae bacterium]
MKAICVAAAASVAVTMLAGCQNGQPSASAAVASAPSASSATATTAATGPSKPMGDGSVWTYVVSDAAGKPVEVGVRMTGAALRGLPADMPEGHPVPVILKFPSGTATGVLNHVEFYWNPMGHEPPGVWDTPHFDYHFFIADEATAREVNPNNANFATRANRVPDVKYMPGDFAPPPGTAVSNTVPLMGLHWADTTVTRTPGKYDFTQEMIRGSWNGNVTFIEPMITREWLLSHTPLDHQLSEPQAYQRSGLYPTTYTVHYDAASDEYSIALGGFTDRTAS